MLSLYFLERHVSYPICKISTIVPVSTGIDGTVVDSYSRRLTAVSLELRQTYFPVGSIRECSNVIVSPKEKVGMRTQT